ncbi:hypothetical protein DFP72DRAFT_68248 [Ephemerocybe angulata]|uniref:G domain-containing protein n=1 Tax=Ephemerocybe angulata TaxID=980116 RepID=A0A8H6HCP4_9AGAR|nr:hypothetical protein DFP72DRAFT_68248 [Tulosesus angulatus]
MGATKAGKSSFINMVLKEVGSVDRLLIGNELASCTVNLRDVEVKVLRSDNAALEGRRVTLVDTPGFDGTHASDFEILKQIAEWLEKSCKQGDVLGGVLYLHDISRDQISGTARRTFELFNHLCGDACLNKAVLVTTKWGRANGRDFVAREAELKGKYWLTMIEKGASTMRLDDEDEGASALRIVDEMLRRLERPDGQAFLREVLQIQDEMVRQKKSFPQTEAAKAVRAWYEGMIEAQAEMLKYQAMAAKGDAEAAAKVRAEEEKLDKLARDVKKLRLSVGQRFLENTQRLFRS